MPDPAPATLDESLKNEMPSSIPVTRYSAPAREKPLRRLLTVLPGVPDHLARHGKHVVGQGLSMIGEGSPCLVMPLVPLHSLNLMALELSRKTEIPMVPYFAELWTADCRTRWSTGLWKLVNLLLEKHTVRAASALVASTEGGAGYFLQRYPGICPPTHVTESSYDPDRMTPAGPLPRGDTLRMGWVDDFRGIHTPDAVLAGIGEFLRRNPEASIEIEHAGHVPGTQGRADNVHFHGVLPWRMMPGFMSSCHILMLSLPQGRESHRCCPGIAADCLRTGRPIMAATPEGDMSQKLRSMGNAYICEPDPMAVASTLENVYDHWRKGILQAPRDQLKISDQLDVTGAMKNLATFLDGVSG